MSVFQEGVEARKAGLAFEAFPDTYLARVTAMGTRVPNEQGQEWQEGWASVKRWATKQERADAEALDISKFRKKSNRYYSS